MGLFYRSFLAQGPVCKHAQTSVEVSPGAPLLCEFMASIRGVGRLMAGHRSGDLLDGVDVIEADVVRREPAFF
jgi:hypothetical protein